VLQDSGSISVADRLAWLDLGNSGYMTSRYDQLIAAYRVCGDEQSANSVGLRKQRERSEGLSRPGKYWGWIQYCTVGYGYRTWWALGWILALIFIGSTVFQLWPPAPKDHPPPFVSFVYSVDLLIPVLNLGVRESFVPLGWTAGLAWILQAAGWILTTAFVAGIARRLNR
jgi:hypothetical protein